MAGYYCFECYSICLLGKSQSCAHALLLLFLPLRCRRRRCCRCARAAPEQRCHERLLLLRAQKLAALHRVGHQDDRGGAAHMGAGVRGHTVGVHARNLQSLTSSAYNVMQ